MQQLSRHPDICAHHHLQSISSMLQSVKHRALLSASEHVLSRPFQAGRVVDIWLLLCFHMMCRMRCIKNSLARAAQMQSHIRVVKQQPTPVLASLLDAEFSDQVGRKLSVKQQHVTCRCVALQHQHMSLPNCQLDPC